MATTSVVGGHLLRHNSRFCIKMRNLLQRGTTVKLLWEAQSYLANDSSCEPSFSTIHPIQNLRLDFEAGQGVGCSLRASD